MLKDTSQRSAISSVLSQASGWSRNSSPHFLRRLQVVAAAGEGEAGAAVVVGGLQERGAGLDGQQGLVRLGVVFVRVVQVVGGHQRKVQVLGQAQQVAGDPPLDVQAVVHELAEVVLRAEDVAELGGGLQRFAVLAQPQPGLDLPGRAAGGGDEAFRVGVRAAPGPAAAICRRPSPARRCEEARNRFRMPTLL